MKKVKVILTILSCLSAVLPAFCQEVAENESDREHLLKCIAEDEAYIEYKQFVNEASYHVAAGSWDRSALTKLMQKYPNLESHCTFPDDELAVIRGGLIWKETYCAVFSSSKKVRSKFKNQHLTEEEWQKVLVYYYELRGKKEIHEIGQRVPRH